jgi:Flp pilus assembly protein TadD
MSQPALEPPDSFNLQAAEGWLGLGNPAEADRELRQLPPELDRHPHVLHVRWEICAATRRWESALEIAASLVQIAPEEPTGWIHRSYSLHELRRTLEARENLLRVVERFPANTTMRYNLACYECQLGQLPQAREWLRQAFGLGNLLDMKTMALADPDLAPLREDIRRM